jgi:hypothetical protein
MVAGIASSLFHELGHCIFYWLQGIPSAFSLMKEFPLKDLTAQQFAIGSAGGPLFSLLLLTSSYGLQQRYKHHQPTGAILSSFVLANSFYCILRSLIALRKGSGEELERAASLASTNYVTVVGILLGTMTVVMYLWIKNNAIGVSIKNTLYVIGLFFLFVLTLLTVESFDRKVIWRKFPTIQIDEGTRYNEHFTS